MRSRVTTKNGDGGVTRTLSGDVLSKAHPILECTGRLDALRAQLALLRLEIITVEPDEVEAIEKFLFWLLHCCFIVGAEVNDPERKHPEYRQGEIGPFHLDCLEKAQARLEAKTQFPRAFIVSAGNRAAALADVTATVARDFERSLVRLSEALPQFNAAALLAFTNRLSDYLYILARHLDNGKGQAVDYGVIYEIDV